MNEPQITVIDTGRNPNDRTLMHVLYAMHTVAWLSMGALAVIAVVLNYVKREDESDPVYRRHHGYMIATFWWTVFWLIITSPLYLLFIAPGIAAHTIVGLWYLYRCLRGWLRFSKGRMP